MSFLRTGLEARGVSTCRDLGDPETVPDRSSITVAGLILIRQRPGTARGVTFLTVEDETGQGNLVIAPRAYDRFRRIIRTAGAVIARGTVQRADTVTHLAVDHLISMDDRVKLDLPARQWG